MVKRAAQTLPRFIGGDRAATLEELKARETVKPRRKDHKAPCPIEKSKMPRSFPWVQRPIHKGVHFYRSRMLQHIF